MKEIIVLGTGTSTGIPMVGCKCTVCTSSDINDVRLRTSILIKLSTGKQILVDTTPDLRTQCLANSIMKIDAAIITHDHADHLHGIDDLRPFCFGPPELHIPVYCEKTTKMNIERRFPYIFGERLEKIGGGIPLLSLNTIKTDYSPVEIEGHLFHFFTLPHGRISTTCFVVDKFAYIPDCSSITDDAIEFLANSKIEFLIIDCLKDGTHDTHLTAEQTFEYIKRIAPNKAGLIHMNHEISHKELTQLSIEHFPDGNVFPLSDNNRFKC